MDLVGQSGGKYVVWISNSRGGSGASAATIRPKRAAESRVTTVNLMLKTSMFLWSKVRVPWCNYKDYHVAP